MSKDVSLNFKLDEEMFEWFCKTTMKIDKNKSETIRACILLSLDTIAANPSLVHRIQYEDRKQ